MSKVTVTKNTYTAESLYQWDKDQVLEVRGLSLPAVPEVHFSNEAVGAAIVQQASMDAAGVITADVPNSLLQKPYKIKAYICQYSGSTFETLYKMEIPVVARAKPADYTLEDDAEVYSFNAMENEIANAVAKADAAKAAADAVSTKADNAATAATAAQTAAQTAASAASAAQSAAASVPVHTKGTADLTDGESALASNTYYWVHA